MGRSDQSGAPGLKPHAVPSEPPIPALAPALRLAAEAAEVPAGAGGAGPPPDPSDDATLPAVPTRPPARHALPNDALPGYDLLREISRGGQGVVYQAVQKSTGRKVAVKVLRDGSFASAGEKVRFEREARVLAALDHPNIVTVLDRGVTAGGSWFFAMDYVPGRAFDEYLADRRASRGGEALDAESLLRLFLKVCDAVNAAHLRGIVHRDLKPSNIRVDAAGEPHVLDFGLARPGMGMGISPGTGDVGEESPRPVTITGQFLGSLPWASPEQAQGSAGGVDVRSDVYSLGVILYQMLTGAFPYDVTGSMRDVLDNIMTRQPAPLRETAGVDAPLEAIVLKALNKDSAERYQSAGELGRDIASYLSGGPTVAGGAAPLRRRIRRALRQPGVVAAATATIAVIAGGVFLACRPADTRSATTQKSGALAAASPDATAAPREAVSGPGARAGAGPVPAAEDTAGARDAPSPVGIYPPAPALAGEKPVVGIPPFKVASSRGAAGTPERLGRVAADQLSTLLHLTGRFEVVERAQLEQVLDEQNLEGIVHPNEAARPGRIRGTDYLVIGRVTHFRVTQERTRNGVEVGGEGASAGDSHAGSGRSGVDVSTHRITTECGVDIRLVDPSTGRVACAHFGEFKRTDTAKALGISLAGTGAAESAELTVQEDDAGNILRLAFDDAVKKMLPDIDKALAARAERRKRPPE